MSPRRAVAAYVARMAGWFAGYDARIRERARAAGYQAGAGAAELVAACRLCGQPLNDHRPQPPEWKAEL